jgi:1,4-alpha-glucan branching enzyme
VGEEGHLSAPSAAFARLGFVSAATQVVNYTASHDEVRPEHEIKFYSAKHVTRTGPRGWTVAAAQRWRWRAAGWSRSSTAPGVPMIYAGQEYGDDSPRTIDFVPLAVGRSSRSDGPRRAHYAGRAAADPRPAASHHALRSDSHRVSGQRFCPRRGSCAGGGGTPMAGDYVVVAVNFGAHESRPVHLPFPHDGAWRELVSNRSRTITGGHGVVRLGAYSAVVFVPGK